MAKTFKLGLIGVGMGQAHLVAIERNLKDIEVIAAADIDKKRLNMACDAFSIPMKFTDYHKMLEVEEIEAVLIVTPNFLHAPMAIDCMKAGKHVLVEKPPALDVEGAEKMLRTSKKTGMKLMYGLRQRFRADTREARKIVERGDLGDAYYARTGWVRRYDIPGRDWFCTKSESGGGALIDLGVHVLDMTWWIMGNPRPLSVTGVTYNPFMKKLRKKRYDVEDFAAGLIRFSNGASIVTETSWAGFVEKEDIYSMILGTKGGLNLKLFPADNEKCFTFYTEKNGTWLDSTSPEIETKMKEDSLAKQLSYFVDCVRKDNKNTASGEEGVELMRMLTGIYESAKTGKEVILNKS